MTFLFLCDIIYIEKEIKEKLGMGGFDFSFKLVLILIVIVIAFALSFPFAALIMWLWNSVMPVLGVSSMTYWQTYLFVWLWEALFGGWTVAWRK